MNDYPLEKYAEIAERLNEEMMEAVEQDWYDEKTREAVNNLFNS